MTAEVFVLTGLNAYEWLALIGSSLFICLCIKALAVHRRDRRHLREFNNRKDHR